MNFYMIYLVLVVVFNIINAAIVVQAPKYVSKRTLQNLVRKYYLHLMNRRRFGAHKGLEIEIPISPQLSQQYRYARRLRGPVQKRPRISRRERQRYTDPPPATTKATPVQAMQPQVISAPVLPINAQFLMPPVSIYPLPDLHYALASENLRRAEEAVEKHLKSSPIRIGIRSRRSGLDGKVYQEDVQKALDRLETRLKAGGNRPATLEDLIKMIDEVEKKIIEKQEVLATSTPDPCGAEKILEEALKPAVKEDLWEVMNLAQNCGKEFHQPVGELAKTDEDARRAIQLTIRNPIEKEEIVQSKSREELWSQTRRSIGQEMLDLIEDDIEKKINTSTNAEAKSSRRRSILSEQLLELLKHGVAVEENPRVLEDKGLIPIKIEVPKSFKDIIIKT